MIIYNVETQPEAGVGSLFTCLFKKIKPQMKMETVKPAAVSNSPILKKSKPKKRKLFSSTKNSLLPLTTENTPPTPVKRGRVAEKKRKALIEDGNNAN